MCSGAGQSVQVRSRGGQQLSNGALLPTCSSSAPPPPPPPPLVLKQTGNTGEETSVSQLQYVADKHKLKRAGGRSLCVFSF